MNHFPIRALALFGMAQVLGIVSAVLFQTMISEVNRKLAEDQQIGFLWGYPGKMALIKQKYKELYPGSRIPIYRTACTAACIILLAMSFLDFIFRTP